MRRTTLAAVAFSMLAVAGNAGAQDSSIDFVVPGPADWNTANNWDAPGFGPAVPGDGFPQEIVSISNAGVATLTSSAMNDVMGLVIGETHNAARPGGPNATEEVGTLNISGAGQLRLIDSSGTGGAALRVGDAGMGTLNISGGSALADSIAVGGLADSSLNLSGDGTLAISGDASVERITRIEGPDVIFDVEGDLRVGGTFIPVITGATHSAITVPTGRARLGGTLQVQFSGYSPTLGDVWTLIDADTTSGNFASIDTSQAASLPRGATFDLSVDAGGSGDVVLSLSNRIVLSVDRGTGAVSVENAVGPDIEVDAYSIGSPSGLLDPAGWQSLQDSGVGTWQEANPSANFLSELDPTDASTLSVADGPISLGNAYSFTPTKLGETGADLTFSYGSPNGDEFDGIIEYTGPENNLVLTVDPATGDSVLTNDSTFNINLLGYTVQSASGSLLPDDGDWNSLQDQGVGAWEEANPSANALNELNPTGALAMSAGFSVNLGALFDTAGSKDLTLEFFYEGSSGPLGDTNGDGVVNIDDLNNVRNNFGGAGLGDTNGDGVVNIDDLNNVRNHFGEMGGGGGGGQEILAGLVKYETAGAAPVPEPGSLVLGALGLFGMASLRLRMRHRRIV